MGLRGFTPSFLTIKYIPNMEDNVKRPDTEARFLRTMFLKDLYQQCLIKMEKNDLTTYDLQKTEGCCKRLLNISYSSFNRLRRRIEGHEDEVSNTIVEDVATSLGFVIRYELIKKA